MQKLERGMQKSEVRNQNKERKNAKVRSQKSEVRIKNGRMQKSEVRSQNKERKRPILHSYFLVLTSLELLA
jgi:hypothetical protein